MALERPFRGQKPRWRVVPEGFWDSPLSADMPEPEEVGLAATVGGKANR